MNKQFPQSSGISLQVGDQRSLQKAKRTRLFAHLESKHVVRKNDDLVPSIFMVFDQELTRLEFVWVHAIK